MKKKTILVTGGAGFIGSHLCRKLVFLGHRVIGIDNLYSGNLDNIHDLLKNENFSFINHDICNPIQIKVDQIYNFACPASPKFYQHDPVKTIKTSVQGAINMLDLAKSNNAKILQASTSEVYGDPEEHPQKETYWGNVNPIGPRSCYDEGKRSAETLFFDYFRQNKVFIKVIRIFNTYGPNMLKEDGRVVSNFIVQAINNEDITIYGSGEQTRCFCYIDDMVNGIILMMNSSKSIKGPINLGNPFEISMNELASLIILKTSSKSKITYKKSPIDDPSRRKPSIKSAQTSLNWKPVVDLNEGLNLTIEYFKKI